MLLLTLYTGQAWAQFFNTRKYTVENSSAVGNILQIQQDGTGAMWWVNDENFTRYNGIVYKNFPYGKLSANYRHILPYVDAEGKMWLCLGTNKKSDIYNYQNNEWKKLTSLVIPGGDEPIAFSASLENDVPWVLLATANSVFSWENNDWEELPLDNTSAIKQVKAQGSTAYIITSGEIYMARKNKPPFKLQLPEDIVASLIDANVYDNPWSIESEPELWVLTPTLIGYVKNNTLLVVRIYENAPYSFTRLRSNGAGYVYLQTDKNAIWQFDVNGNEFRQLEDVGINPTENINELFTDRENNLWIATEDGLLKTTSQSINFITKLKGIGSLPIQALAQSGKKTLAAGPKGITVIEDGKVSAYHPFTEEQLSNPRQYISQLWADSVGNVWLLTNISGLWYGKLGGPFTHVKGNTRLVTFMVLPDSRIYAASEAGLFEATPDGLKLINTLPPGIQPQRLAWHYGSLILLSNKGIYRLDKEKWIKLNGENGSDFSLPVYAYYHVYDNLAILGTEKGIFYLKEFEAGRYDGADSVWGSRPYYGIAVDKKGAVWLASDTGLVVMEKRGAPKIFAYGGFHFKETEASSLVAGSHGEIWVGMRTGLMVYQPEYDKFNGKKPQVLISRIETRSTGTATLNPLNTLKLKSNDNDITFYFDANSFIDEDKNKLLYKLEGYMKNWEELANLSSNSISFKNLPPGKYVLKMQLINAGGVASDIVSSPAITISKPFYNQWWFYGAAIAVFFGISFGVFYLYSQKKFENDLLHEVEKRSRELRSSEDRFRTLWESTSDALVLYNLRGDIIIYNDTFLQLIGRTDNIAGRKIYEVLDISNDEMNKENFRQNLELQNLKSHFEIRFSNKAAEEIVLEFSNTYLLLPNEKSSVMLSLIRNVTQRKQTEENLIRAKNEAEQASRVKSAFLATMSHEIRTPLNAIIGMSSVMSNTRLDEEQTNYVNAIKTSSDSLLSLVNNILDFSKIEAGMMMIEKAEISPEEIINETLEILGSLANEKGIYLYTRIHPDTPVKIISDKTRLRQVLINLVGNAIKFTEKGFVEITLRPDADNMLKIAVTDTGIGIPRDRIKDLFKVFTQVDDTTTRKYGGTGLGLAITEKLVALLDGQIKVASQENKGSQFSFTFKDFSLGKTHVRRGDALRKYPGFKFAVVSPHATVINIFRALNDERGIRTSAFETLESAASGLADITTVLVDAESLADSYLPAGFKDKDLVIIKRNPGPIPVSIANKFGLADNKTINLPVSSGKYQKFLEKVVKQREVKPKISIAAAETGKNNNGRVLKILVVDDNKVNLMMMEVIMKNLGYGVDFANNGREAVEKCDMKKYDLVFMDVQMPEMDGIEATREIKNRTGKDFPSIVALTANAFPEDKQACLDAGMVDFLPKPVTVDTIKSLLAKLFVSEKIQAD